MLTKTTAIFSISTLFAALTSCSSSSDIKIVKANPDLMYQLETKRTGSVVVLDSPSAKPNQTGANPASPKRPTQSSDTPIDISRLRLPDMEKLPGDNELNSTQPDKPDGGVIIRPPGGN